MSFGKLVKECKNEHGLTYSEIGKAVGVTKVTISNICADRHLPNIVLAMKLVLFLEIADLEYMLNRTLEK